MSQSCFPPEEFGRILELPPDAPERVHVETCPRCRALLSTYQELLEDRSVPAGADLADAETRLREAFRSARSPRDVASTDRAAAPRLQRWIGDLVRRLGRAPVLVPVSAVLLAIVIYAGYQGFRSAGGPDQLRGAGPSSDSGTVSISLIEPRPEGTESVELRWHTAPGVSTYQVILLREDLGEMARMPAIADTTCRIRWSEVRPRPDRGSVIGWQVLGLREGAAIASSRVEALRVP